MMQHLVDSLVGLPPEVPHAELLRYAVASVFAVGFVVLIAGMFLSVSRLFRVD